MESVRPVRPDWVTVKYHTQMGKKKKVTLSVGPGTVEGVAFTRKFLDDCHPGFRHIRSDSDWAQLREVKPGLVLSGPVDSEHCPGSGDSFCFWVDGEWYCVEDNGA